MLNLKHMEEDLDKELSEQTTESMNVCLDSLNDVDLPKELIDEIQEKCFESENGKIIITQSIFKKVYKLLNITKLSKFQKMILKEHLIDVLNNYSYSIRNAKYYLKF